MQRLQPNTRRGKVILGVVIRATVAKRDAKKPARKRPPRGDHDGPPGPSIIPSR